MVISQTREHEDDWISLLDSMSWSPFLKIKSLVLDPWYLATASNSLSRSVPDPFPSGLATQSILA
jgi:hypothetical protein